MEELHDLRDPMGEEDEGGGFRDEGGKEHGAGSGEDTLGWAWGATDGTWEMAISSGGGGWGQVGLGHMVRDIEGASGPRYKVAERGEQGWDGVRAWGGVRAEDGRGRASGRRDGAGGRVEEKGWPDPEAWWKAWKSPVQGSRGKYPAS